MASSCATRQTWYSAIPTKKKLMPTTKTKRRGPVTLFPGKIRKPVTITLTVGHHRKVNNSMKRLGLSQSDILGLLIEKYADPVTTAVPDASTSVFAWRSRSWAAHSNIRSGTSPKAERGSCRWATSNAGCRPNRRSDIHYSMHVSS